MNPQTESASEETVCADCGKFGAVEVAGKFLCADCITQAGCACGGRDDE